jgi:hypothetical protein
MGRAKDKEIDMCLVEVNTYGIKPKIFEIKIIKKID